MRAGDGQDVTRDDTDIVSALRAALADRVGTQRYELWFGANTRFDLNDRVLTLSVPSRFFLEWIRANFRRQIEAACEDALGRRPAIEFRVDSSQASSSDEGPPASGRSSASSSKRSPSAIHDSSSSSSQESGGEGTEGTEDHRERPARRGLSRRRFSNLESFVTGHSNRLARASAELAAARPGELSPLLIHGPTGVGKTHLLEGIWTATRKARRAATVVYLSSEQFTTFFLEALRGSGLPSFRRKYRGVDVLIIDDLQFFCGKRATQVELQYTIDTLLREGRQLVFAADRPPSELTELAPELITRLQSGMVCRVDPPELETRLGIVGHLAAKLKIQVPDDVRRYIAEHFRHHARELSGALCRLRATSREIGRASV